jgi:regulator of replication initiation timing
MKNIHKIGFLIFILIVSFIFILSYQSWKQNVSSCSCRKEGMSVMNQQLQEVLSHITGMINVLNGMSNELNKLRDWLVVHNDTLDKKTVQFAMVNISGNLANMSSELSAISSTANTYSGVIENAFYRQAISKIANDLGNQSIVIQNASNDLMVWSQWLEQNNHLNELPGNLTRTETTLSQLSIYLTGLANQLNAFSQL